MESVSALLGDVVALLLLAAIPICFLKARRGLGWIGILTLVVGAGVGFPLFMYLRDRSAEEWFWMWQAPGLVLGGVVIVGAYRPARAGSWWHRRYGGPVSLQ